MVKCILVLVFVIVCSKCVFATSKVDYLDRHNFQVGISSTGVRLSNSTKCGRELQIFLEALDENQLWASKLIDSFGVVPKLFHWGNYFWYSAKVFCEDLNEPLRPVFSDSYPHAYKFNITSPYALRLWMVYFNFTSSIYVDFDLEFKHIIHVGLCLPQSCSLDDAVEFSQTYFAQQTFELQPRYDIQMNVLGAKTPEFQWTFLRKTGVLISIVYLALSGIFMMIASKIRKDQKTAFSKMEQFILCFHLKDNYQRIMEAKTSKGFLSVISGLRAVICIWIAIGHANYFSGFTINNVPFVMILLQYIYTQPLIQICFFVDVFFIISSFLLVYNFLSNLNQMKVIKTNSVKANLVLFLRQVLNRYARLLPIMVTTIVLVDALYDFMDMSSPLLMGPNTPAYCKESWWYNILFINNFIEIKHMCSTWTWYLGCEMQFFIIFNGILFVFAKNRSAGRSIFIGLLLTGVFGTCFLHYYNDYTFQFDVMSRTTGLLYTKPWARINSYTGGALIGWLFYKRKEQPIKLNGFWKFTFWTFTSCLCLGASFMTYWRTTPTWIVSIIMSFGKLIFALCIGGVIIFCEWGYGGRFNAIMSSRAFLFLDKFCFSIYMMLPVITIAAFGLQMEPVQLSEGSSMIYTLGVGLLTFGLSFVVVLLVESPAEEFRSKFIARKSFNKTEVADVDSQKSTNNAFQQQNPLETVEQKAKVS